MPAIPLKRVLIVDDDPSVRDSLAAFLIDYDYEVLTAGSAEEALISLAKTPCDLAVVDLRLPGMSGDALILRAYEELGARRFLIHTGSKGFTLTEELKNIGMTPNHVFLKPLADLSLILVGIKGLLGEDAEVG